MTSSLPALHTAEDCTRLKATLGSGPVLALWATAYPRSTVDILLHFRQKLQERGWKVVLLLRKNAESLFYKLCLKQTHELTYIFDNRNLLEHCDCISLLFTHDYCIGTKPENFSGKIALFPHNIQRGFPSLADIYADYFIGGHAPVKEDFSFAPFPNHVKIQHNTTYTVIPAGYGKFDLLCDAAKKYGTGPFKRVVHFPVTLHVLRARGQMEASLAAWIEMLETFFLRFPDHEFVLRPFSPDRKSHIFRTLREHFAGQKNFILDMGDDNKKYLMSSDLLVFDYSAVEENFVFSTLHPAIALQTTAKGTSYAMHSTGYIAPTGLQAVEAIQHAFDNLTQWEDRLRQLRDQNFKHFGHSLEYLADHVQPMLHDAPPADWLVLDKGDAPYERVADYLRLLRKPLFEWCPRGGIADPMFWSKPRHGFHWQIALAALRCYLRTWPPENIMGCWTPLKDKIEYIFYRLDPRYTLGVLQHAWRKQPDSAAVTVWFAVALSRFAPDDSRLPELLQQFSCLRMDPVLTGMAARLVILHQGTLEYALQLFDACTQDLLHLSPQDSFCYVLLLLRKRRSREAETFINAWESSSSAAIWDSSSNTEMLRAYRKVCRKLLTYMRHENFGIFPFAAEGEHVVQIQGYPIAFASTEQALECIQPLLQEQESRADYEACARFRAACGDMRGAVVWGWKAVRTSSVDLGFLPWLAELLRSTGDAQGALELARFSKKLTAHAQHAARSANQE